MRRWAVLVLALGACGEATSEDGPPIDGARDAAVPSFDASATDGGPSGGGGLFADPSRAAETGELDTFEPGLDSDAVATCFDGEDSDGDGATDCADPDCVSSVRSCCAGRGDCCAEDSARALFSGPAALVGCESAPADCLPATAFGSPGPFLSDGLSGGGDGVYDSGLLFDDAVDLSAERATLTATFALPTDCTGGCLESVSFGFTDQPTLDERAHVAPVLALTLAASRGEVSLRVGDRTVARFPAAEGAWALHAAPDGTIGVTTPTDSEAVTARFVPTRNARPVVWGHNGNPSATADPGARLRSLMLTRALCDMPRAWAPATVVRGDSGPLPIVGRPTVAAFGDEERLAWASDGAIRFATRAVGTGIWEDGGVLGAAETLVDPELVPLSDGLGLFASRGGDDPGIVRADDDGSGFTAPELVLEPASVGARHLDRPTLAIRGGDPALVMVARAEIDGASVLHTFASADAGETWEPQGELALPPIADAEELGAPSLSVFNGAYLLYLPVRRGTRWRIAQLASDDFRHWRLVDDAALVTGPDPYAPLGARAPEARPSEGGVELFYLGLDGVAPTPLRTWRAATDVAILPGR